MKKSLQKFNSRFHQEEEMINKSEDKTIGSIQCDS